MARTSKDTNSAKADKEPGRIKQFWQVFQMTRKAEPIILLWFALILLVVEGIAIVVGINMGGLYVWYWPVLALLVVLLAWLILLSQRAQRVAFRQIEGQPGAALAALKQIRRGWDVEDEPVAIDAKSQDMVFRAVGRPGVVLVGEDRGRLRPLMQKEERRLKRLLPNVPVTLMLAGKEEGEVPLHKLATKVQRLKPALTKAEVAAVHSRLHALGGAKLPMPKGIDPLKARPDRKSLRGR